MRKKLLSLALTLALCLGLTVPVAAEDFAGSCGANVAWSFEGTCLTVSGTGPMEDYFYGGKLPEWDNYLHIVRMIQEVNVESGVTHIGSQAFGTYWSIYTVTIPASVTSIGNDAFKDCESLTDVYYGGTEAQWNSIQMGSGNERLRSADIHCGQAEEDNRCGDSVRWSLDSGGTLIISGTGPMWNFMLRPAPWELNSVRSVVIENGVTSVGSGAFSGASNLTSVTIPASVTAIEDFAFQKAPKLAHVSIAGGLNKIGSYAFYQCTSLTNINIPNTVVLIEKLAFAGCTNLASVTTTTIQSYTYFGVGAPGTAIWWEQGAFKDCSSLTTLVLPEGFADTATLLFENCTNLKTVYFPSTTNYMSLLDFRGCNQLTDFYYAGTQEEWAQKVVIGNPADEASWANITFHYNTPIPSGAPTAPAGVNANPNSSAVLVNGKEVAFDAYTIDGSNYFKLRDLAYVLNSTEKQFEVGWDNASKTITLTSGRSYTANGSEMAKGSGAQSASVSAAKLLIDGKEVSLTAYTIGGNNYFKLRDIGQAFDFGIGWDNTSKTITIDTSTGYAA